MTDAEAEAMIRARDRALQTSAVVRKAFLQSSCAPERIGREERQARNRTLSANGGAIPGRIAAKWTINATSFQPLTLGALWLLEEVESCLCEQRPSDTQPQMTLETVRAAFILSDGERARDALRAGRIEFEKQVLSFSGAFSVAQLPDLCQVTQMVIGGGLETIPGAGASPPKDSLGPSKNSGNGWTLSLLDTMLSEYSWPAYVDYAGVQRGPIDFVLWRLPLAQAFCLYRATAARYGIEMNGPTFVEQEMIKARASSR